MVQALAGPSAKAPAVTLALGASPAGPWFAGPWILPLITLGSRASRYAAKHVGEQLVIALSVPTRDLAAALIGCGWIAASAVSQLGPPDVVARALEPGTPVRLVTDQYVVIGGFTKFEENGPSSVVRLGGQGWQMAHVRAIAPLREDIPWERRQESAPLPGSLSKLMQLDASWEHRLCCPVQDLALVGTAAWLHADLDVFVNRGDASRSVRGDALRGVLLPEHETAATWSTRIYSTTAFLDDLDDQKLSSGLRAIVLDGASASKCLADLEVPVVFTILDRSVADDSAQDAVLSVFRSRGTPLSVHDDLGWCPPTGVEALAFTVPL